ncbi:unnamed protein product, partial [marine sediment metagenome]
MMDKIEMPVVEIVEDGYPQPPQRLDPNVMSFLMMAAIARNTSRMSRTTQALYDHAKDLEGEGLTRRIELTITDKLTKLLLPELWQSASITNDGDKSLYVRVNNLYTTKIPVNPYEVLNYDAKTHKLKRLYLECDSGESTSVRIIG